MKSIPFLCSLLLSAVLFSGVAAGQDLYFDYLFSFEPTLIDKAPTIGRIDIKYPDEARKKGVEGVCKAKLTFGENGRVRNVIIVEDLPFGVGMAVTSALEKLEFKPATFNGTPTALNATFKYEISATYSEFDSNVTKVKLIGKPTAEYPASLRPEGRKGEVRVGMIFYADGRTKVLEVKSTMPREFDLAAKNAATSVKFEPAIHKKSKKPVTQTMWVIFEFTP